MIRAYIPRFKLIESDGGRNYYAYVIEICYSGKSQKIEKRYSAFHRLYKELQKIYITGDFPPKRLRNTTSKILELRRAGLESWLQSILKLQPIPSSVLAFLQLPNYQAPVLETANHTSEDIITHQPILTYTKDPFLLSQDHLCCLSLEHFCSFNSMKNPPLTDSVTKGVLMALYDPSSILNDM